MKTEKNFTSVAEELAIMSRIGRVYNDLWLFRKQKSGFQEVLEAHEYFLRKANGEEWVAELKQRTEVDKALAWCGANYREWQQKLYNLCQRLLDGEALPEPQVFNRGVNEIINNFYLFGDDQKMEKLLIALVHQVLGRYPDNGYAPDPTDERYHDKIFNGSLIMGGADVTELRVHQVWAEENYKRQKQ